MPPAGQRSLIVDSGPSCENLSALCRSHAEPLAVGWRGHSWPTVPKVSVTSWVSIDWRISVMRPALKLQIQQ
jgi:hypothetical protein